MGLPSPSTHHHSTWRISLDLGSSLSYLASFLLHLAFSSLDLVVAAHPMLLSWCFPHVVLMLLVSESRAVLLLLERTLHRIRHLRILPHHPLHSLEGALLGGSSTHQSGRSPRPPDLASLKPLDIQARVAMREGEGRGGACAVKREGRGRGEAVLMRGN